MSSRHKIYLDNAASTPLDANVKKEIERGFSFDGNPSSFNDAGRKAREELEKVRLKIAQFLGAHNDELVFTSSGSESNNLAIKGATGVFRSSTTSKREIITTLIEHPSVLKPMKELEETGFKIKYLKLDKEGTIDLNDLATKLNRNTLLVSVMYANNEIGTIEPIAKASKVISEFNKKLEINEAEKVLFHTDACQAVGYLNMKVNQLGVDLLTFNGTKIYGPRGVGVLYIKRGVLIAPQILGGDQEHGLRAGTENLPAILGLTKAIELIDKDKSKKTAELRDYFLDQIKSKIPEAKINGALVGQRLPNNISISMPSLSGENILLELDKYSIYAGSGSACTARSVEPSHVLKAIGTDLNYINGTIRLSLGRQTTKKDLDYVLKVLVKIMANLKKRYKK